GQGRRMDRPHSRAVRGQSDHPAGLRLHRPTRPDVGAARGPWAGGGLVKVSEIMTKAAVTDQSDDTMAEAAGKMWKQQTGSLLVMEGEDLVGIITERDILKAVATGSNLHETRISEVMTKDVVTVGPQTTIREAA